MMNASTNATDEPRSSDFPASVFMRVVRSEATLATLSIRDGGDVHFSVSLANRGLRRSDFERTAIPGSTFFIDWAGEVVVRKNIGVFADKLEELDLASYDRQVNAFECRHFGLTVDEKHVAHFTFHLSLVQKILTEELNAKIAGWLTNEAP